MQLLANKVALITGASKGIGLATAKTFHAHGAHVLLVGRSETSLEESFLNDEKLESQDRVSFFQCDVAKPENVQSLFREIFEKHKRLDIAVSNAGIMNSSLIGMVKPEQLVDTFSVNTFGTYFVNQFASRLIARSGGGSIINVSSILGVHGAKGQSAYSASKAAILGLTKSLAKEFAANQIRVNAIAPGMIDTDITRKFSEADYQKSKESIAMGRVGTPEEVADVILFLASDLSRYVTGQVIGVDGGMVL